MFSNLEAMRAPARKPMTRREYHSSCTNPSTCGALRRNHGRKPRSTK